MHVSGFSSSSARGPAQRGVPAENREGLAGVRAAQNAEKADCPPAVARTGGIFLFSGAFAPCRQAQMLLTACDLFL